MNSHFGLTMNPSTPTGLLKSTYQDPSAESRVAGGSSGGSAAAVAANLCQMYELFRSW